MSWLRHSVTATFGCAFAAERGVVRWLTKSFRMTILEYPSNALLFPHLYLQQLARAHRALVRYRTATGAGDQKHWHAYYETDDHYHNFFQACWHVKDWLYRDWTVADSLRLPAVIQAEQARDIRVSADIANSSKHLVVLGDRTGAQDSSMQFHSLDDGSYRMVHVIELGDGTEISAVQQAERCLAAWRHVLSAHGLPVIVDPT